MLSCELGTEVDPPSCRSLILSGNGKLGRKKGIVGAYPMKGVNPDDSYKLKNLKSFNDLFNVGR